MLMHPLKHAGLALATSLSAMLNLFLLYRELDHKLGGLDVEKNIKSLLRSFFCSFLMGLAAYLICSLGDWTVSGKVMEKSLLLGAGIVIGLGIYLACSYWVKNEEMLFLLNIVKRKMKR